MHFNRLAAAALTLALAASGAAAQMADQNQRFCRNQNGRINLDLVIRACTQLGEAAGASAEDRSNAFANRGVAYTGMGQYAEALRDFTSAIGLDGKNAEAFNGRGQALTESGKMDEAFADFERAIALDPGYANAYYNRGNAYAAKGDMPAAIASYDRAIALLPSDIASLANRAIAHEELGEFESALADYDALAKFTANGTDVYYGRGRIEYFLGRFAAAANDFNRVTEIGQPNPYYLLWQHIAVARAGRAGESRLAAKAANLALVEWPGPVLRHILGKATADEVVAAARNADRDTERGQLCEAYYYLGQLALLRGERSEAERLFRLAVATDVASFGEYKGARVELGR